MTEKGCLAHGVSRAIMGQSALQLIKSLQVSADQEFWIVMAGGECRYIQQFWDGDRLVYREHVQERVTTPYGSVVFLCLVDNAGQLVRDSLFSMMEMVKQMPKPKGICLSSTARWVGLNPPARRVVADAKMIDTGCFFQRSDGGRCQLYHYRLADGTILQERVSGTAYTRGGLIVLLDIFGEDGIKVGDTYWRRDQVEEIKRTLETPEKHRNWSECLTSREFI